MRYQPTGAYDLRKQGNSRLISKLQGEAASYPVNAEEIFDILLIK